MQPRARKVLVSVGLRIFTVYRQIMSDNFRKWRSNSEVKPNLRDKTAIVQTGLRIFVIYRETLAHAFKKWRAELSQVTP